MKRAFRVLAVLLAAALLPWVTASGASGGEQTAERVPIAALTVPAGREAEAHLLTDGYAETYMRFRRESTVRAEFETAVETLVTVWEAEPESVTLLCYAGEELLGEEPLAVPYLTTVTALPKGTTAVELSLGKRKEARLCELYAFDAGALPETEFQWEPSLTEPDVMLVVAYPGDEYRFFGGLLPKLLNDGAKVQVCYFADYSRERLEEGFSALWSLGLRNYPALLHVQSKQSISYLPLARAWKSARADKKLEDCLKEITPKIVVAPSDAETGCAEERVAAEIAKTVCGLRSSTVQKLYLAGAGEAATVLPDEQLPLYGNESAAAIARSKLITFRSADFFEYRTYEDGAYRLVLSAVGEDMRHDSLFEHIDTELHPSVTATPVPTDTPEPTEAPNETPEPTDTPEPTEAATDAPTDAPVPTAEPTVKAGLFSCAGREATPVPKEAPTAEPTAEPTEAPTEEPTPEPTEEPTPEPTEEPTPEPTETPDPHFLREGEAEQVTEDRENGYWSFRDPSTHIEIRRVNATDLDGDIQVYFIAHVWMRGNRHRSGFGDETRSGRTSQLPYRIARRYGAVLLITGDNIINMDVDRKGALIRDGIVYNRGNSADVMAWNDRTLTFDLYRKGEKTAEELQEMGYRDVYSFGPILVQDGTMVENLNGTALGAKNPRCGVGTVEPGHFVVIVVDGRQLDYAIGLRMEEFAQLFLDEGCVSAYNLDGGVSAAMLFMGEHLNTHLNVRDRSRQRNLPDGLLFGHTDSLPDELDPPPQYDGIRTDADDQLYVAPQNH